MRQILHRHLESFSWVESTFRTEHTQHKHLNIAQQILGLSTADTREQQSPLGQIFSLCGGEICPHKQMEMKMALKLFCLRNSN